MLSANSIWSLRRMEPVPEAAATETEPVSGAPELDGSRAGEGEPPAPSAVPALPRLPGGRVVHGAVAAAALLGAVVAAVAAVRASGGSPGAPARSLIRGHVGDPGVVAATTDEPILLTRAPGAARNALLGEPDDVAATTSWRAIVLTHGPGYRALHPVTSTATTSRPPPRS